MLLSMLKEALCGELHATSTTSVKTQMQEDGKAEFVAAVIVPSRFKDDVDNLKAYVGNERWQSGLHISLSLQELLGICPRKRKRSDAYAQLIKYLASEQGIELTILKFKRDDN